MKTNQRVTIPEIGNLPNWSAPSQAEKPIPAIRLLQREPTPFLRVRKRRLGAVCMAYSVVCCSVAFGQANENIRIQGWATPTMWQPASGSAEKKSQETRGAMGQAEEVNAATTAPSNPLTMIAVPPCRLADTRSGGPLGGAFNGGDVRNLNVPAAALSNSACAAIPAADAYSINVTVVPTSGVGYLSVFPNGQPLPLVSTLNWGPAASGGAIANAAIVPGGPGGVVNFYAAAPAQVIVDINGYFLAGSGSASAVYQISGTQPIPPNQEVRINFNQKIKDTQNTVLTGTNWQFRAPLSGTYHVTTNISIGCSPLITSGYEATLIYVQPSGSATPVGVDFASEDNGTESMLMSSDVPLNAGDLLWVTFSRFDASCGEYAGRIGIFLAGQ